MTTFGDFDPADALDTDPPDPEAVARIVWAELRAKAPKVFKDWDSHTKAEKAVIVAAFVVLIKRLVDEWKKAPL